MMSLWWLIGAGLVLGALCVAVVGWADREIDRLGLDPDGAAQRERDRLSLRERIARRE